MSEYSEPFRAKMVHKMMQPSGPSATALAVTTGVPQPTLSKWLRDAKQKPMPNTKAPRRPRDWKPEDKLRIVTEAAGVEGDELGVLLRREGLHEADLGEWRRVALGALGAPAKPSPGSTEARRIRELEKQLHRKDKALAEAAALLILKKKVQDLWGDEDDDTKKENDK